MNMKKMFKCIVVVLVVMMCGLHIQPDDKELFMGSSTTATQIKPNVLILMDSSGSMNNIVFFPKKGLDKIVGTEDDGYDPSQTYSGDIVNYYATGDSSVRYRYNSPSSLGSPRLLARWRTPDGDAELFRYNESEVGSNYTGCYESDGTGSYFRVGGNGTSNFNVGERIMYIDWTWDDNRWEIERLAVATISQKDNIDGNTWFKLTDILGDDIVANSTRVNDTVTIEGHFQRAMGSDYMLVDFLLYGLNDDGENVRYPKEYLDWVYCNATVQQLDAIGNFFKYGVFVYTDDLTQDIIDLPNSYSICDKENNQWPMQRWTRIQVAREVLCWLAREHSSTVMLGLYRFSPAYNYRLGNTYYSDADGGDYVEGLGDMSQSSQTLAAFLGKIWNVKADSWTPLAEALADVWYYYMPGPDSKTYWPVEVQLDNGNLNIANTSSQYITNWCQNNYVVIMTDGESTKDDFDTSNGNQDKFAGSIFTTKPVKRQDGWQNWSDGWGDPDNNDPVPENYNADTATYCPNWTCWLRSSDQRGTDLLDDVAYFLRHQDLFPDDDNNPDKRFRTTYSDPPVANEKIWPGDQNIYTYTIGFNFDNHLLQQAAINGDGGYYKADSFEELQDAFENVITNINLRNYAFSSITAPKKTATATSDDLTVSYVGYFLPSKAPIWEGHLMAFELVDKWGFDADDPPDQIDPDEYDYNTQEECLNNSGGKECVRSITLSIGQEWDAANKMPTTRYLYTHDYSSANPTDLIEFTLTNDTTLRTLFGLIPDGENTYLTETQTIITKIQTPQLADVFHSDVGFVGPPPYGKQFISKLNPTGTDDETFAEYYTSKQCRDRVIYAGTNDGIMHMFYGDAPEARDLDGDGTVDCAGAQADRSGKEIWGFIPDEVLPTLAEIVLDNLHHYTVDGRMTANDIYYKKGTDTKNTWSTILTFGLRRGGRSFYTLDISDVGSQPTLLWKFKDAVHSGQSWGKPTIGRLQLLDGTDIVDKWVVVLAGGFEFNSDNSTDTRGKAVFVVDAATGELIWKVAYTTPAGEPDTPGTDGYLDDKSDDDDKFYTTVKQFNYPIPSSVLAIDRDNSGFLDTIYFGNIGGHLFKADISNSDPDNWTIQLLFEDKYIPEKSTIIDTISGDVFNLDKKGILAVGDSIMGKTSYATGHIVGVDNFDITVTTTSGTFQAGETVVSYTYDPIYLPPAAAYDNCYQLWLTFGTGDRDRPRTNLNNGRFIAFRDNGKVNFIEDPTDGNTDSSTLAQFTWSVDPQDNTKKVLNTPSPIPTNVNGFYFDFPDTGEKLFDPDPIIIPDENVIPHIYLNTYQPPPTTISNKDDPCDMPQEGTMKLYDIALKNCGNLESIEGEQETGRIAGGGIYEGKEYVMYTSQSGAVADVPGGEGGQFTAEPKRLPYPGGLVFWKEKKR